MSVVRPMRYEPGTFLRPCDLCGIRFRMHELVRGEDGFWRCRRWCQETPQITRDKISGESQRRKEAPAPPHGIPFDRLSTFEAEERIFWLLCEAPNRDSAVAGGVRFGIPPGATMSVSGTSRTAPANVGLLADTSPASETIRYLYAMIVENKRPTRWITAARAKLIELADWIITHQAGFGAASGEAATTQANNPRWGAIAGVTPGSALGGLGYDADQNALAGLALLLAYRATGTASYLVSAKAVASYLRNAQAIGKCLAANFTSSDAAGTVRLYTGGIAKKVNFLSNLISDHQFWLSSTTALEFLRELFLTVGDGTYGSPTTIGGIFATVPAELLSVMLADLRAFYAVGAFDVATGTTYTGLSATTPREFFNAYPSVHGSFSGRDGAGSGSWEYADAGTTTGTTISGANVATCLRSLFVYEGYSSQLASVWTWLMSFSSNASFICAAGTLATDFACASTDNAATPPAPPVGQGNIVRPAYDPSLALTTTLLVRDSSAGFAATAKNATAQYDWSTAGLMAAIQSSQNAGAFRRAKETVSTPQVRLPAQFVNGDEAIVDWPTLRGRTGLSLQMSQSGALSWSTQFAAQIGAMYRYQPQSWVGTNSPQQQPGPRV